MYRGITTALSLLAMLALISACKTTGTYTRLDKNKKYLSVYSSGDKRSAMVNPSEDRTVTSTKSSLKSTLKKEPNRVNSWLNLAKLYVAGGELDEAEEAVTKAIRQDFKSKDAKLVLAQIHVRRGQYELAEIVLNGLGGARSKDSEVLNLVAMIALAQKEQTKALALFKEALELDPGNVSVRMNLGVLNLKYRQLSAASVQFERVLKLVPEHTDAKLHLAIVRASRGEVAGAEELYKEVLSVKRANPLALYNLAVLQKNSRSYDDAMDNLKTYLRTSHAKSSDTDQVFALIEEIKDLSAQEGKGRRVSDEDIQKLATDLETKQTVVASAPKKKEVALPSRDEDDDEDEPVKRPKIEADKKPKPAAAKEEPEVNTNSDEIEDLERTLLK